MGYRHDRTAILDAAADHVVVNGFDELTFGKLAASMRIADRTIVYYFPWKAKLIEAVVEQIVSSFLDLVDTNDADVEGALVGAYLEAVGRAAGGNEPYASVVRGLRGQWLTTGGDARRLSTTEAQALTRRLAG